MTGRFGKEQDESIELSETALRLSAQAAYAESIFQLSLNDVEASIGALEYDPGYAPAIFSMGSVEYQRDREAYGKELFMSLVSLPDFAADGGEPDLAEIIDKAGSFLIQIGRYDDGFKLYRAALARFPQVAVLQQGLGCCAGHEGRHEEAIAASKAALSLEPENQEFVNDLGWCLLEAGQLEEARQFLSQAVSMDPTDDLARENLRRCNKAISDGR